MSPTHVRIDQGVCHASGHCSRLVPEVFTAEADGLGALVTPAGPASGPVPVPDELVERVWDAANTCPACAIHVSDGRERARLDGGDPRLSGRT